MSTSFLERNKKKESRGLGLFAGRRRGLAPLALLVVAVMAVFVAPANLLSGLMASLEQSSWGRPLARAAAFVTGAPAPQNGADAAAEWRAARQQSSRSVWSFFARGGGGGSADSLGLVRGGEHDVLGAASIASKIQGGKTINGVLSPEDSRRRGAAGVELSDEDLQGGLVASAAAAVFPGANLLTGGRVAPATQAPAAAAALGAAKVPQTSRDKRIAARAGRLSKTEFRTLQVNRMAFDHASAVGGPGSALGVLGDARTQAQLARDPNCTASNSCPPEYANMHTGAVYDGNHVGPKAGSVIQSAPAVYGLDGSNTTGRIAPSDDAGADDDVERIKRDQRACDVADATYKPLLNPHVQRMGELAKMGPLPSVLAEQRKECRIIDDLLRQQYDACPLRREDGPYEPRECD